MTMLVLLWYPSLLAYSADQINRSSFLTETPRHMSALTRGRLTAEAFKGYFFSVEVRKYVFF